MSRKREPSSPPKPPPTQEEARKILADLFLAQYGGMEGFNAAHRFKSVSEGRVT